MPRRSTISALLKRIQHAPRSAELHQKLGSAYLRLGMESEAKAAYERALELDPCDPWTLLYFGNWHYWVDEDRKAVEYYKRAGQLLPSTAAPFWALGDAYAALGLDSLATESYQRALSVEPEDKWSKRKWLRWRKSCEPEN